LLGQFTTRGQNDFSHAVGGLAFLFVLVLVVIMVTETDIKRLEDKLDKLTDAVMRLVILEERQLHLSEQLTHLSQQVTKQGVQFHTLDRTVEKWINRGIGAWGVASAVYVVVELVIKRL
jgi:hypothetical protein